MGLSKRIKSAGLEPARSGTDLTCGLKLMQNKKRSIAARSTKMNASTATQEQLDVAIPPATNSTETIEPSQTATSQEVRGEHSPEALTPTSIVNLLEEDDGPHMPEGAGIPEAERVDSDERSDRRRKASLDETRDDGNNHQNERHKSAAP